LLKVTTKKGRKIGGDMVATKKGCQKIEGKFLPFRGGGRVAHLGLCRHRLFEQPNVKNANQITLEIPKQPASSCQCFLL